MAKKHGMARDGFLYKFHRVPAFINDRAGMTVMTNVGDDGTCPCCHVPLASGIKPESCMLNDDCCPAAGRCGLIGDAAFWEKVGKDQAKIKDHAH